MNTHRRSSTSHVLWAAITVAMLFTGGAVAQAQAPPAGRGTSQPQSQGTFDETQAAAMMAERQKIMENMRALDQKLNVLVAKINTVHGEAKIDAVAAVVRELVTQRTQMHGQMEAMQTRMMNHMMQHMMSMQGGMMSNRGQAGAMQSMSNCPMMKELSKEAAEADHSAHH